MTQSSLKTPPSQSGAAFAQLVIENAGILDPRVAETLFRAFASVPRVRFLHESFSTRASEDVSFPIPYNQTSSKPSVVARMMGLLGLTKGMRVLEIGTGSGYSAAVMAAAGAHVYSVEIVGLLAQLTRKRLDEFSLQNVLIQRADGRKGWREHAPYDGILVSTPFSKVEEELLSQLSFTNGRMVLPVGDTTTQTMTIVEKSGETSSSFTFEKFTIS
jgi:protein-L-isoaspartate(D-aspartate) O-methyltransferase